MLSNEVNRDLDTLKIATSALCEVEDCSLHMGDLKSGLKVISLNIRSIYKNFEIFEILLLRLKVEFDILILSECRLSEEKPIPILHGFNSHVTKNCKIQNDGVVIYVSNHLQYSVEEPQFEGGNYLVIKLKQETAIVGIYRSPSYLVIDSFLNAIEQIVSSLKLFSNIALIGDINLDIRNNTSDHKVASYLNLTAELGLLPAHTLPTRENNCLDHVLLKTNATAYIAVLQTQITDHLPVVLSINKPISKGKPLRYRIKTDWQAALTQLKETNFDHILNDSDINTSTDGFIKTISDAIIDNTKRNPIPKKYRIINPWITPGILRCIRIKDKLHQELKLDALNINKKITYIRYAKLCSEVVSKAKNFYNLTKLENSLHSSKLTWKAIKDISHVSTNKNIPTELLEIEPKPEDSIEAVNMYFSSIGRDLCSKICQPVFSEVDLTKHINPVPNSFVLMPTDEFEIGSYILGLKSDSASGWDNISPKFLKLAKDVIVPPLTKLFNLCIEHGKFPTALKKSIILPIHKSGDKFSINNYRPISILPSLSKVFEKLLNSRLISYLNSYKLLATQQYGFRANISTEDAVINLCNTVSEALDSKKKCIGIFLDLAKAFDTVSIPMLINKMERLGIRGNSLKLFSDFLCNRSQRVKIGDVLSSEAPITFGVPQGSILGPSLFLIYINDLCQLPLSNANIFTYADDTALVFQEKTWNEVFTSAENGLQKVIHWLNVNLLTLNVSKTKFIPFALRKNSAPPSTHNIIAHYCNYKSNRDCDCHALDRSSEMKYLGVTLDEKMSWLPHIKLVTSRTRKLIWVFKKLRHVANPILLKTIYLALCQSVLTYCITVWGGCYKTHLLSLERAQRSVLKTMAFKSFRHPTTDLYKSSQVLTVRQLFILYAVLRTHVNLSVNLLPITRKRRNNVTFRKRFRTEFMHHQFQFLSSFLYDYLNKNLKFYFLNKFNCKVKLTKWLLSLTYEETELLLRVQG